MFRVFFSTTLMVVGIFSISYGQEDFEDWKRRQDAAFEQFKSDNDKAFLNFLKRRWEAFEAFKEPVRDPEPKPVSIPSAEKEVPVISDLVTINEILPSPLPGVLPPKETPKREEIQPTEKIPPPLLVPEPVPQPPAPPHRWDTEFQFFGVFVGLDGTEDLPPPIKNRVDSDTIADYWEALSVSNHGPLLRQLQSYRSQMKLNDWGYSRLIYEAGKAIYPNSPNTRRLFIWFNLNKSGYLAKVGYGDNEVALLLPSLQILYGSRYYRFDGHSDKFYVVTFESSDRTDLRSIHTYRSDYPGATRRFDLRVTETPNLGKNVQLKTLDVPIDRVSFLSSADVAKHYMPQFHHTQQEVFTVLILDARNRLIREHRASEGSLTASIVHPREVFKMAIIESAASVIFLHNHPSGDPTPSQDDIKITKQLVDAGKIIDIRVLDHIILGYHKFTSLSGKGLI